MADVLVIGGGPAGCAAALAFARRGAGVQVLEARPGPGRQLAGEWLHPKGVQTLAGLGVDLTSSLRDAIPGRGFIIFPDDGSEPVTLPYDRSEEALCCCHEDLVAALRRAAAAHPGVRFLAPCRARAIDGQKVTVTRGEATEETIAAPAIVGADGHASVARRCLGGAAARPQSLMAGVLLEDVDLPCEGFGHIVLGGPGPALLFRIGARQVRLCLDLPLSGRPATTPAALWSGFGERLPATLRAPFRQALERQEVTWTATHRRPRRCYGRQGLALVGDAVGQVHPLSAAGMTMGLLDATALAASRDFRSYRRDRSRESRVQELLAGALYDATVHRDAGAAALRQGLYRYWRQGDEHRAGSLRLASGAESSPAVLRNAFLSVLGQASHALFDGNTAVSSWPRTLGSMGELGRWLKWPLASMPGVLGMLGALGVPGRAASKGSG